MAFATDIALNDAAAAAKTFSLRKSDGYNSERIDQASTQAEPRLMIIKHSKQGAGDQLMDRHLLSFMKTKKDSVTGKLYTAVVNVTVTVPANGVITRTDIDDLIVFERGFLTTAANVDKFLRSEP